MARLEPTPIPRPQPYPEGPGVVLLASPHFVLRRYEVQDTLALRAPAESFAAFTRVQGEPLGESFVAGAGTEVVLGPGVWLEAFMPSPKRLAEYPETVRVG